MSVSYHWNNFLWPLIVTRSADLQTLPLGLARFLSYQEDTTGALYAFCAFLSWGFIPVYFKAVEDVPVVEVVAHRIVWAVLLLAMVVSIGRQWPSIARALTDRRAMGALAVSTVLLSSSDLDSTLSPFAATDSGAELKPRSSRCSPSRSGAKEPSRSPSRTGIRPPDSSQEMVRLTYSSSS